MGSFKKIIWIAMMSAGISAHAQLELDSIYPTEYIKEQFAKAVAEKDSAALGIAAYKLSGNLDWEQGPTSKNIDLVTLSLECFAAVGDSEMYYYVRPILSDYYVDIKLYQQAETILSEARGYYKRTKNLSLEMHMVSRLAHLYDKIGNTEKSKIFKLESHHLNKVVKDTLLDIIYLVEQTYGFKEQEKYDSGLMVAHQCLDLSNAYNSSKFAALSLFNIGILNQIKGNIDLAIFYLRKAEKREKPQEYSELRQKCFKHLTQCFEFKKDFKNAYRSALRYSELSDSILNKNRIEAIDKMTLQFESKEKQAAIDLLEKEKTLSEQRNRQKNLLIYGLTFLFAILLVLLGLAVRFYRQKIKQDKIISSQNKTLNHAKIKSLENEMRLTSVKSMLDGQEKERSRIAGDLHDSLGGLLSTIKLRLKNTNGQSSEKAFEEISLLLDKAANEVRSISQNLQPSALQQFGFIPAISDLINSYSQVERGQKIKLQHYNVPEKLDVTTLLQFYRIIQEALNNAFKHAEAEEILIQINGQKNGISILIEDDGKGFNIEQGFNGSGLQNIRKRAEYLQAELTLEANDRGTTVFLFYPYRSEK